jgi:CheY-like chemotaxis protein
VKYRPSVLVVDPDPLASQTLSSVLGPDCARVHSAPDGSAAADALRSQRFDVVIVDLEQLDWSRTLGVILATDPQAAVLVATSVIEHAVEAMRAGATDAISKPYAFDELRLRVAAAAERRLAREKLATYEASQLLHTVRGQDAVLAKLSEVARQVLGADEVGVLTRADSTQLFDVIKGTSFPEAVLRWLADLAASEGRGRIWPSPSERPLAGGTMSLTSSLAFPLIMGDEVLGVLLLLRRPGSPAFAQSALEQGAVLAGQLALALDHGRFYAQLESRLSELGSTEERRIHVEKLGLANELAASVAHEVNNPLTFVQMNVAELRAMDLRTTPTEEVNMLIDETSSGIARIAELVAGFGRLASPSPVRPPARVEAVPLARDLAVGHEADFRAHSDVLAFVDPATLRSGVEAILAFFRRQTKDRTKPIRVEVGTLDHRPAITISDDSLVLTQGERMRMFDPRVDVDTRSGRTMRLDLDLAVAYQALRSNGVDVQVSGSDERGVRIDLLLPAVPQRLGAYAS